MSIILLRGFSNSGKDYVGQILCEKYQYTRFAFADSLKKIVADNFECSLELLHSQEGKIQICETDISKRTYRQILIDEALRLRNIDSGIFAKHCCSEILQINPKKIVITDWRYPNEFEIIKNTFPNHKIIPVFVQRADQIKSPVHDISEYLLTDRLNDFVIHNKMDNSIYCEISNLINFIDKEQNDHLGK